MQISKQWNEHKRIFLKSIDANIKYFNSQKIKCISILKYTSYNLYKNTNDF